MTTATDVYALGVVLYELLVGRRPYAVETRSPSEIERIVTTAEPPRPSAAGHDAAETAALRSTTPARLASALAGDLDAITLQALRKEPERRYGSAADLRADLGRHLAGLPVEARGDGLGYRARTFARRHRVGLAATVASLIAIGAVAAAAFVRVSAERDRAETALDRQAAVSGFLADLLQASSPRQSQDREVTVRELLDQARADVGALDDRPAVQADVLDVLGNTYYEINDYETAADLQRRALALRQRLPGTPDSVLIDSYNRIGITFRNGSQPDSAIAYLEAGLALARERLGPDAFWNVTLLDNLSDPYVRTGQHARAEAASREVIAIDARTLPPDDPVRSFGLNNLATTLTLEGRYDEAEPLFRETVRLLRGADNPRNLSYGVSNLAWMLTQAGRPDKALPLAREGLALRIETMGTGERFTAESMKFVADALTARGAPGDYAEADSLYRRALGIIEETVGDEHLAYAYGVHGLGELAMARGRPAEAADRFERVLALRQSEDDDAPREVVRALVALGDALDAAGDRGVAARRYREARTLAEGRLPDRDAVRSQAAASVGLAEGDDALYRQGLSALAARVGNGHPLTRDLCRRGAARELSAPACG